jgi:outer membrane protein OmpA-like peptidoglycan-associated protein
MPQPTRTSTVRPPEAHLPSPPSQVLAAATLLVALALPSEAQAQVTTVGGLGLNQLNPAPAGDDFVAVQGAQASGHLVPRAYLMFDYAVEPLLLAPGALVSDQGFLRLDASLSLFDRILVAVDVPVALVQRGDDPQVGLLTLASPSGVEMGEVRLDVRGRLYGDYRDPLQLALGGRFFFPTSGSDSFAGEGTPRVEPIGSVGGRVGEETAFLYGAHFGWMLRGPRIPHSLDYGAAAGVSFADDLVQVNAELFGSTFLGKSEPLDTPDVTIAAPTRTSLEFLGSAKLRVAEGLVIGAGAGPGITDGLGTPTVRALGFVGWAPMPARDRSGEDDDGDGVLNGVDACPSDKGVASDDPKKNGCTPPDRDGDKVVDTVDACPSLPGRPNADATRNGCPSDYDRDGIADSDDACPNQRGVASIEPARNGCPGEVDSDLDGIADKTDACPNEKGSRNDEPSKNGCPTKDGDLDGIADREDACPNEKGLPSTDKAKNGCPKDVRVHQGEIVILRQVRFKVGEASLSQTVDPVSDDLLTEVRNVILEHPEIEKIEVQGHADDTGSKDLNEALAQQRADAVKKWLVSKGIDGKRLVAKGYGARVPIDSNATEEGRQRNRRVQFVITERKP